MSPVAVMSESHNAGSELSVEMLNNLDPSFVLDLTAAPRKNSSSRKAFRVGEVPDSAPVPKQDEPEQMELGGNPPAADADLFDDVDTVEVKKALEDSAEQFERAEIMCFLENERNNLTEERRLYNMWENIALTVASSVSEAACSHILDERKRKKFNNRIKTIITSTFDDFADSSLDCSDFYQLTQSIQFTELIRNLFFSLNDKKDVGEYFRHIEAYIYKKCPQLNPLEVRSFLNKILDLYKNNLHKMIENSPELNVVFQLLTISHREILGKISESEDNLLKYFDSLMNAHLQIDDGDIKAYHDICEKECSTIRFTGISGAESKKAQSIDEFYVENTFSCFNRELENLYGDIADALDSISLKEFFKYSNKIVLIGGAGLGKSTTLNYLFCKYEQLYQLNALKIKIDLKEYAKDIGEDRQDLLWCLATEFYRKIKRTKVNFSDIEKLLAAYLDKGSCLVILDALDEIPTLSVRNKVRDEIGRFCDIYYLNRFIITTREAGYLRNRFDETFLHIRINQFTDEQIQQYCRNWFKSNYSTKDFDEFWVRFYQEVERARCQNLIRNPIILILALVIFDVEKNLPNRRVEFYRKCIDTFLTVREDRKAVFQLTEKAKNILGIDLVVPKIAFYRFDHLKNHSTYKFSYDELKRAVLYAIEVDDPANWREAIRLYVQYLVERTELIQEVDEDILDFAHKTFYEYFLAIYFSKEYENEELVKQLEEWIGDSNYDELARLIIEIVIQNDEPRQHKYLINYMLDTLQNNALRHSRQDIFDILADLYHHNMLQPKFHTKYYECILYHPECVYLAGRTSRIGIHTIYTPPKDSPPYDSRILAAMFTKAVNEGQLAGVLSAVYYLNNDFRRHIAENIQEDYLVHITRLFSACFEITRSQNEKAKVKGKKYELELDYFLSHAGIPYTLQYPEVFICVANLILTVGQHEKIGELLNYNFEANSKFFKYTSPRILSKLFLVSCASPEYMLTTLLLIIHCAKKRTNNVFWHIFRWPSRRIDEKVIINAKYLWDALNDSETFGRFQETLSENGLYDGKYRSLYEKLYLDYVNREKQLHQDRVEEFKAFFVNWDYNKEISDA